MSARKQTLDIDSQIDLLLLDRKYMEVQTLFTKNPQLTQDQYYQLVLYKVNKLCPLTEYHLMTVDQYTHCLNELKELFQYNSSNPNLLDIEATKYQLLEFVDTDDLATLEQTIFEFELKYASVTSLMKNITLQQKSSLIRKVSYLEAGLKLMLNPKQRNSRHFNHLNEITEYLSYFYIIVAEVKSNDRFYKILQKPLKSIFILVINLILCELQKHPIQMNDFFMKLNNALQKNEITTNFMNIDLKITLYYTIAKIILPVIEQSSHQFNSNQSNENELGNVLSLMQLITKDQMKDHISSITSWDQLFQYTMLSILQQIHIKASLQLKKKEVKQEEAIKLPFVDQLFYYVSINFTQLTIKLKQTMKRIISHNFYSLVNLYCCRFNRHALMTKILEDLMITPFEDDILRMKMCINLYQNEEYSKLHQLVQILLASEKIKDHQFRQIIIDLCCVFSGIYLGKSEEGLCFARLNLHDVEHNSPTNSILQLDTIVAHVGYSYYNLGRASKYVSEQNTFFAKAIEYLERSLQINNQNYLVHYNLSKLYAYLGKTEDALTFAKQACSLNKGEMNCLILCSVLYSAKDENQKALMIVDQIIKENPNKPILYLIKASILSEKYLLNLQRDKELKASDQFRPELKQYIIKKHQKSKEAQNILSQLQRALFGIAKQLAENDKSESFTAELIHLKTLQSFDVDPMTYISYRNCLLYTIDYLIKIDFLDIAQLVIEYVDDGSNINLIEKLFYTGLIQEKSNQIEKASITYEEVLKVDFYHVRTMCNLALLYLKQSPHIESKVQRANELLIVASKFEMSHFVCLGFALLNQIQGNIELSNDYLLKALHHVKSAPVITVTLVPDKLFYIQ